MSDMSIISDMAANGWMIPIIKYAIDNNLISRKFKFDISRRDINRKISPIMTAYFNRILKKYGFDGSVKKKRDNYIWVPETSNSSWMLLVHGDSLRNLIHFYRHMGNNPSALPEELVSRHNSITRLGDDSRFNLYKFFLPFSIHDFSFNYSLLDIMKYIDDIFSLYADIQSAYTEDVWIQ